MKTRYIKKYNREDREFKEKCAMTYYDNLGCDGRFAIYRIAFYCDRYKRVHEYSAYKSYFYGVRNTLATVYAIDEHTVGEILKGVIRAMKQYSSACKRNGEIVSYGVIANRIDAIIWQSILND